MANEQGQDNNPEPGWVFHPETGKVEKTLSVISDQPAVSGSQKPVTSNQKAQETNVQPPSPEPTMDHDKSSPLPPNPNPQRLSTNSIEWSASEFVAHNKSASWYLMLCGVTVLVGGVVYLLTKDIFSVIVIAIFAVLFGIIAGRKPQVLNYRIDQDGLAIGDRNYTYGVFKSFSVMDEGAIDSIALLPLKRFALPMTIYFAPDEKDKITDILTHYLPYEDRSHDIIDRAMHRIRF